MSKTQKIGKLTQIHAAYLMPTDRDARQILEQRAHFLAQSRIKNDYTERQKEGVKYICFNLGSEKERYGLPYQFVKEVINNVTLTKLPAVPKYIAGVMNRHGTLIAVIDLKHFFHTKLSEYKKDAYIIVITVNSVTMGLLADNIEGSDNYDPSKLDPPFSFLDIIKPELIIGLHEGITAIINIETLILSPELQIKN